MSDDLHDFDLTGALPFDADADAHTPQKPMSTTLGIEFAYVGEAHTAQSFASYCASYHFGTIPPDYVVLHHTAVPSTLAARYPTGAVWDANEAGLSLDQIKAKRLKQLGKVRDYYRDVQHWDAGPHLWIDELFIYLFTPMYDVGIHAASGNSYHDRAGKLHYSIGIEVVGYYEKVQWPRAVARNVGMALAILRRRLGTFSLDYRPGPRNTPQAHVGSLSSHRDYNKPACPGKAITEAFYVGVAQAAWRELTGGKV